MLLRTKKPLLERFAITFLQKAMLTVVSLGVGHQSLRGLPTGFQSLQQAPQNRSVSNRLPQSDKMGANIF